MKKPTAILIFLLLANFAFAQVLTLDVFNPAPRVGDKLIVYYKLEPEPKPEVTCQTVDNSIVSGNFRLEKAIENKKEVKVGPFVVELDGKQYKSESMVLKVFPELPDVKTGFWVRFVECQKNYYIITEFRTPIKTDANNGISARLRAGSPKFQFTINPTSLKEQGLRFIEARSNNITSYLNDIDKNQSKNSFNNIITVYRVALNDSYKNNGIISKALFDSIPPEIDFEPVKIKFKHI
jgi:hypothetical protein